MAWTYPHAMPSLASKFPALNDMLHILPGAARGAVVGQDFVLDDINEAKYTAQGLRNLLLPNNHLVEPGVVTQEMVDSADRRVKTLEIMYGAREHGGGDMMNILTQINTRLTNMDTRIDNHLQRIETRLTAVETRLTGVERLVPLVTALEVNVNGLGTRITGLGVHLTEVENRLTQVQQQQEAEFYNAKKKLVNARYLSMDSRVHHRMKKTVVGTGIVLAQNLHVPALDVPPPQPLNPIPLIGAVRLMDVGQISQMTFTEIFECIVFYNDDFDIVVGDDIGE